MNNRTKRQIIGLVTLVAIALPLAGAIAADKAPVQGVININTASPEELTLLPGIGKSKAAAIVSYRQSHPFKSVAELTEVKGIGPKKLEKIQSQITVEGPTTAGTRAPVAKK